MPLKRFLRFLTTQRLHFNKFGVIDHVSDHDTQRAIFIDIDAHNLGANHTPNIFSLCRVLGITVENACYHRTRRGWHIALSIREALCPVERVAVEAILGDDPQRAALNFMRAMQIGKMNGRDSEFWNQRWNILYAKKL